MSMFGSVQQARSAGYEVCRVDDDGILVRHLTRSGAPIFGWVPRPARFVKRAAPAAAQQRSFWFP